MIVIAGNDHDLSPRERSAKLLEKWPRGSKRISTRAMAQLEHIPQQDKSIYVLECIDQRGARPRGAQDVGAGTGSQMQI
jgi:hypothetical protein